VRVRWTRLALAQLAAIQEYIAEESLTAASGIVRSIRMDVGRLADSLAMGRPSPVAGTRELVVNKGRHVVASRVQGQGVEATVIADDITN